MSEHFNGSRHPFREDHRKESSTSNDTESRKPFKHPLANHRKAELPNSKLYIYPLKESHTEEALHDIFSKFGEVTEIYIDGKNRKWAFVSMKTVLAAEKALNEIGSHPEAEFEVRFSEKKQPESASAAANKTASTGEGNYRNSDEMPQTGKQFINSFRGKSLPNRSVPETSERTHVNTNYQTPTIPNGNNSAPIPSCWYCKRQTVESCTKCIQPFCSRECMIRGFEGHTSLCICAPPHSSQLKNLPKGMPVMNSSPYTDVFPTISQDFADMSRIYLDHSRNPAANLSSSYKSEDNARNPTANLSNSYKADDLDDLDAKGKNLRNMPHRSPAQAPTSRKFESRQSAGEESPKKTESIHMNGMHRMTDQKPSHRPSSINAGTEEDAGVDFNNAAGEKRSYQAKREWIGKPRNLNEENESQDERSHHPKRERDGKFNHSNKENESQDERSHHPRRERDGKFNQSNKENDSFRDERNSHVKRERDGKFNTPSRDERNKENDSSWQNRSPRSENRSKREDESPRDNQYQSRDSQNQSRLSRPRPKENKTSWDNDSTVSGYMSKNEDESTWDNEYHRNGPKKDSLPSRNTPAMSSGSRPRKESAAERIRSSTENASPRENRSPASGFSGNRSYNEKIADNEINSKQSWDNEHDGRPRDRETARNVDASPPSPQKSECNSPRPRNPPFSPPPRADIKNHTEYEVRLVQKDPYAVIIMQEANALNYMMDALQKLKLEPIDERSMKVGLRCVAIRDGSASKLWCRCVIHEMEPLSARFIDFKHEPERIENVRQLPEEFIPIPPFCYRVQFLNAKSYELDEIMNSQFDVEFVAKDKVFWQVNLMKKKFDEEITHARNIRDAPRRSQDYSDLKIVMKEDVPMEVFVTYIDAKSKKIFVSIFDKSEKLMNMITSKNPSTLPELKELRVGAMCLALFENCWFRARIVSVDPLRIYYVDFGNIEPAQKSDLRMPPDEFAHIDPLAVAVKFRSGSTSSVTENETVKIVPIEMIPAEKVWLVRLASEPEILQKSSTASKLPNEGNAPEVAPNAVLSVIMTHPISTTEYYVGYENHTERLSAVEIKEVEVRKMEPLRAPSLGTLCLAVFDSFWSRAKIVKLEPPTIFFLDFGNEERAVLKDLYPMPEKFLSIPPMAFKIHLQEPQELEQYVPFKIRKVSEKYWRVERPSSPKVNENIDVQIMAAEDFTNQTYGVIPIEMMRTFEGIQKALLKRKSELPVVKKPEVNLICADSVNVVARVQVLSEDPLYVNYLDFGYEEMKESCSTLRRIPNSLADIDPVAIRITLASPYPELEEGRIIRIKILEKIFDEHYYVELIESDNLSDSLSEYGSASEANTTFFDVDCTPAIAKKTRERDFRFLPPLSENCAEIDDDLRSEIGSVNTVALAEDFVTTYPSLPTNYHINEIDVGTHSALTVMDNLTDSLCTGALIHSKSPHVMMMKRYLRNLEPDSFYRPKVGDIVAAVLPDSAVWSRSIVLTEPTKLNKKYRVAMFDAGCVQEVDKIAPLHDHYRDLSNLSVYCQIKRFPASGKPLKQFKVYNKCKIIEKLNDGTIIGRLRGKAHQDYEVCFKPWEPTIDELGVPKMPVVNDSRVKITAYNTSNTCHLWDLENERVGLLFTADIEDYCLEVEPMTEEPYISEIVGVHIDSENTFWRGQVLEKLEDDSYSVFLLDRGITHTAQLKHLRSLPYPPFSSPLHRSLKTSFAFAVPATLKDVPVTDITIKVSNFMQHLIQKECTFDVRIDEETGEVELKFVADENYSVDTRKITTLNEYLADLLTPDWKKCYLDSKLVFDDYLKGVRLFMEDIRYDELVVGSKVSLYVAEVMDAEFCVVNKSGKNYIKLIEVNLYERLIEYATTVTDSYVPAPLELCIAEHDNMWHRALCLQSEPNAGITVQLIDEGRIEVVSHTRIRRMVAEFSHHAATALLCRPKDVTQIDVKKAALLENETIRVRIVEKVDSNEYLMDCQKLFAKLGATEST